MCNTKEVFVTKEMDFLLCELGNESLSEEEEEEEEEKEEEEEEEDK
jgi:hypothetical protein